MLILMPPSETKRPGGTGAPVDVAALALPDLSRRRVLVTGALMAVSADADVAARVLRIPPARHGEIADNVVLDSAPTRPAIDRYAGVLYDALAAASLDAPARAWLGRHALIHSAAFGPIGALDAIPRYRMSAATTLPGVGTLRRVWADAVGAAFAAAAPSFVLDLRSAAYVALGPVPAAVPHASVAVVTAGPDGAVRAVSHHNKRAKGELVRALAIARPWIASREQFLDWARDTGRRARNGPGGGIELFG